MSPARQNIHMSYDKAIKLRGVEVHNLRKIDLDIPHRKLIVLCGVSGSGKSSLALDTLYLEGQRRYIESFSSHARQFLDRLERPAAELLEGIPPTVAVAHAPGRSPLATVGTATEIHDYLRLLFARFGEIHCAACQRPIQRHSAQSVAVEIESWPAGRRWMLAFPMAEKPAQAVADVRREGFRRVIIGRRLLSTDDAMVVEPPAGEDKCYVVVDRLTTGNGANVHRLIDSLETAFRKGLGRACALVEKTAGGDLPAFQPAGEYELDGTLWWQFNWSNRLQCPACGAEFPPLEPRLFNFQSPFGACPGCEGLGTQREIDWDLVIPNRRLTLRGGAIAPWNEKGHESQRQRLLELATAQGISLDTPYAELDEQSLRLIENGIPDTEFSGLGGFFQALQEAPKVSARSFLARWRSPQPCRECGGQRLRPEACCVRIGGKNIAECCGLSVNAARSFLRFESTATESILDRIRGRLDYLNAVGLGYLALDRPLTTLSAGESRRVRLASALGSSLVNMLYILDEPTAGLHPRDSARLLDVVRKLRDRGNTVLVVEHEEVFLRGADLVIEIGPGAGSHGGQLVFQGTPGEMLADADSPTGGYLRGQRGAFSTSQRLPANRGRLRLIGARGHNLKNFTVDFPLGVLCAVTGVSGAGKSSLVVDTLYPAMCQRLGQTAARPLPFDDLTGEGQFKDVVLVDAVPLLRSARSNPAIYVKAFDEIRALFAETTDARIRNYSPGKFSFNVEGGRCENCRGEGTIEIDMQFLPDITMTCPRCHGRRYLPEILQVKHRDRNISEVLDMTVREAFAFFRGSKKIQAGLKRLMDVGLDYVALGQNADTLSGGEAQRLKLAGHLATARSERTLFLLEEPTTGLHFADILKLLDCFSALLAEGHSIIVIEHNMQLLRHADYIIDIGPGAAEEGGSIVAQGTPEEVAACATSATAPFLKDALV